jgi:hypothetical protein
MFNKVFLSYASEDYITAEKLYDFLSSNGFTVWMDKKKLLPGQRWDSEIQLNLRKADFIILLLSEIAVSKRGYIQREFKKAVTYCEEKLESDIYIIPVKIGACQIPDNLSQFQWIEFSQTDSNKRILEALNVQRSVFEKIEQSNLALQDKFRLVEKTSAGELGTETPKVKYNIDYKVFHNTDIEWLNEVNLTIENEVLQELLRLRYNYFSYYKDTTDEHLISFGLDAESNISYNFHLVNDNVVSFATFWSVYEVGAAHGQYWISVHNYLTSPLRKLSIWDFITNVKDTLSILRNIVHSKLMEVAKHEYEIENPEEPHAFYLDDPGIELKVENFEKYYITNSSIVFVYNPYHLTPWVYGMHEIEIKFTQLKSILPKEEKLLELISMLEAK